MIRRRRDYPKKLVVGDTVYDIRFCKEIKGQADNVIGYTCRETDTIFIRLDLDPIERWKTFFHEWAHALETEYELEIPHELIYQLEEPIYRFFVDNGMSI